MATLLVAMESQRGIASTTHSKQQQAGQDAPQHADPAASINKVTQLLNAAVGQLSQLLSEGVQLFPSDMEDALKPYRCVNSSWSPSVQTASLPACGSNIMFSCWPQS
jgi:hypothetical protein